jgi:hypothetical protein
MDDKMMIRADARAMGAVTALTVGGRRKPRTRTLALTPCVSYNPRNGQTIDDAVVFAPVRSTPARRYKRTKPTGAQLRAAVDIALMARMGTIHDTDDM